VTLICRILPLLLVLVPATASAQSFVVHGSAGPTMVDGGYSLAAGAGFLPSSRVTFLLDVERTHLFMRTRSDGRGGSTFRGGTVTLGTAEVQVSMLRRQRASPYVLGGFAAGISRPNINSPVDDPVTHSVRAMFLGGGIQVPIADRLTLFADGRVILGAEAGETLGLVPVRAGVAWRF